MSLQKQIVKKLTLFYIQQFLMKLTDLKNLLGCSDRTVTNKLTGETDFTIPEALKIRETFFPGLRLEYLFAADIT